MAGLGFLIYKVNHALYLEDAKNSVESVLTLTQELLEHEKQLALSVALMLSQNETLKKGYLENNRSLLFATLHEEIPNIKRYLGMETLEVQLHSKEGKALVRSWDFGSHGDELLSFRKGVSLVQKYQTPFVSVELGKRLNIKAIAPVFLEGQFIGSLEVILDFETIAHKLREKKIHFAILMEKSFLEIGEWMKEKQIIKEYVLLNSECIECIPTLQALIEPHTLRNGFARENNTLFGFTPLFDIEAKQVGYIGIWFDESLLNESLLLKASLSPTLKSLHVTHLHPEIPQNHEIEIR